MERQGYMHGGYCRAWTAQLAHEKQGKTSGEHSILEELLNFSNEEEGGAGAAGDDDGVSEAARGNCSADSSSVTTGDSCANSLLGGTDNLFSDELICPGLTDDVLSGGLCEPFGDLAELEWLSNFVEDSYSGEELHKQHLISGFKSTSSELAHSSDTVALTPTNDPPQLSLLLEPIPAKARSKRVWKAPSSWSSRLFLIPNTVSLSPEHSDESVKKRVKKRHHSAAADGRKCLHCAAEKTPQWRSGPMGPKTLCNACGVRFKSGRLVPEYRPASSPTFMLCMHSNSHRKVLELRRQKENQRLHLKFLPAYGGAIAAPTEAAVGDEILIQQRLRADLQQVF